MTIDWNEIFKSGKQYSLISDEILDGLLSYAGKPKTVLDLACGSGDLLVKLARRGLSVTGSDISSVALTKTKEAFDSAGFQAVLVETDLDSLDFITKLAGPYDAIFMRLALAFIKDKNLFLKGVKSLLAPKGTFFCTTPVLLEEVSTYDVRQNNISIHKKELEEVLARHFTKVELVVQNELNRPEWPLATYACSNP